MLWAGDGAVVSHRTAGVLWELDGVTMSKVEITVPVQRARARGSSWCTAHLTFHPHTERPDTASRSPAVRTLVDLAGCVSDEVLEAALESAFRRRLARESALRGLVGRGRAGAGRLREILDRRDDAALESRLDVKVWRLLMRSGLPKPVRQHPVEVEGHYHEPLQRLVRQQQS
jgi:hypothetical protein